MQSGLSTKSKGMNEDGVFHFFLVLIICVLVIFFWNIFFTPKQYFYYDNGKLQKSNEYGYSSGRLYKTSYYSREGKLDYIQLFDSSSEVKKTCKYLDEDESLFSFLPVSLQDFLRCGMIEEVLVPTSVEIVKD